MLLVCWEVVLLVRSPLAGMWKFWPLPDESGGSMVGYGVIRGLLEVFAPAGGGVRAFCSGEALYASYRWEWESGLENGGREARCEEGDCGI